VLRVGNVGGEATGCGKSRCIDQDWGKIQNGEMIAGDL
jgi:hypothetical protein